MNHIHTRLGELECQLIDELPTGVEPKLLVVLCHGYGAPGDDLVPVGSELLSRFPSLREHVRLVFPAAPLRLAGPFYDGRAWWNLDLVRLGMLYATGDLEALTRETPEGLAQARRQVRAMLDRLTVQTRLPMSHIVLGGFSQGAMLTTDVTLRLEEPPAALCIFSGSLLMVDEWRRRAPMRAGLKVLQSHGREDELLPFELALRLCTLLQDGGLDVDFVPFDGGHTIAEAAVEKLGLLLEGLV